MPTTRWLDFVAAIGFVLIVYNAYTWDQFKSIRWVFLIYFLNF